MTESTSRLVALARGADNPPFFCFPGAVTTPMSLYLLAQSLGKTAPVYSGLYAGIDDQSPGQSTIEDISSSLVQEILEVQPDGLIRLGGYCLGGLVAWDLANQLMATGREIAVVVMIDTVPPVRLNQLAKDAPGDAVELDHESHFLDTMRSMDIEMEKRLAILPAERADKLRKIRDAHNRAGIQYRGSIIDAPIAEFHTRSHAAEVFQIWGRFSNVGYESIQLPGNTQSILTSPLAEKLGTKIANTLEKY